jgi:hypothetical protein
VQAAAVAINQAVGHALEVMRRRNWRAEAIEQVILHQTSETTLEGALQEINSALGRPACNRGNVLFNVAERGNTATTTHFVALADAIRAGKVRPGSKVLFGITGSGQTVERPCIPSANCPDAIRARPGANRASGKASRPRYGWSRHGWRWRAWACRVPRTR